MTAPKAAVSTKEIMRKELIACAESPEYFLKTYAKIVHPTRGRIPFKTYAFQDDCLKSFMDHRFNIVLKSRQLGLSTVTAGFATWYAMFARDKTVLVIATKLDVAMNFIKKVKTILSNLPPWFGSVVSIKGETKKSIELANGSTITAIPTSEDAGRSEALSLLIVDEAAIIKDFEEVWTGLYPTISTGGRAILLSTPKGAMGQFYEIWQQAINGENDFNATKLMWYVHPEHDEEWFKKETRGFSPRKISQEFLCDFNASGDTFITVDDMEWLRSQVQACVDRWGDDGNVWVWEKPQYGEKYCLSGDVSRGNAEDFSTFHVFKMSTNELVAEYKGKLPPDEFGVLINDIGKRYNTALVCPENNTFGYSTIRALKTAGYKNLYYEGRRPGYVPYDEKEMAGFSTQKNTREKILTNLERAIRNKTIKLRSERLYLELKTFVWIGQRARAQDGNHDDLVMSAAIGAYLLDPNGGAVDNGDAAGLLGAMSVSSRDAGEISGLGRDITALANPNMMVAATNRVAMRPIMGSETIGVQEQLRNMGFGARDQSLSDFSWVLKGR